MINYEITIYDMRTHLKEINLPTGTKLVFEDMGDGYFSTYAMLTEEEAAYIKNHFSNVTVSMGK